MGDDVTLPDRNGVRTPMQWDDGAQAGFSQSDALYARLIHDPTYGFQAVNVAAQIADEDSFLHVVRKMIALRKELPLLAKGKLSWLLETPKETLCFERSQSGWRFIALHNISAEPQTVTFPEWQNFRDVFEEGAAVGETITLPPHGYRWLVVRG